MLRVVAFGGADRDRNSVVIASVACKMPSRVFRDWAAYSDGGIRASSLIIESVFTNADQLNPVCSYSFVDWIIMSIAGASDNL